MFSPGTEAGATDGIGITMTFVFIIGTGRCGSSLISEVLARHPQVGFISNADDRLAFLDLKGRWNNQLYARIPQSLTTKGRLRYAPSEGYRLLERHVSPMLSVPFRDLGPEDATPWLSARARRFFEGRSKAQQRDVFLHKFTGWPRTGFLGAVFPEALFIHITRDGRAVANSLLQMPWWKGYRGPWGWEWGPLPSAYAAEWEASGRSLPLLAGLQWKLLIDAHELAQEAAGAGKWLTVRYEDIVSHPRAGISRLLNFIGLEWNEEFERGFAMHSFHRERTAAYLDDLSTSDVQMLEASLEGHLTRLGYQVRTRTDVEVSR